MSLFTSLLSSLDQPGMASIASALEEAKPSITRGMQSSIAAVLGGVASKAGDPGALRSMLDSITNVPGGTGLTEMAKSVSDSNSPLMSAGRRMLSGLFGSSENAVNAAISRDSGLPFNVTSTLMSIAAPMVMGFLAKRVRDDGISMTSLGGLLQRETTTIRSALPASVSDLLWPAAATAEHLASPVIAQSVEKERSSYSWLPLLALAVLVPGLLWLFAHRPKVVHVVPVPVTVPTGTANRVIPDTSIVRPNLPSSIDLRFDTGSVKLRPESEAELQNFATALKAYPDAHVNVGGHTDNQGSAAKNRELSQRRADGVMAELVGNGISRDRITGEAHGDEYPIANNLTAEGRALNRRVSVGVTPK